MRSVVCSSVHLFMVVALVLVLVRNREFLVSNDRATGRHDGGNGSVRGVE